MYKRYDKEKGEKKGYLWKSARIKIEYSYILNFLKYHCILHGLNDELIFDKIINYGIDYIKNNNIFYNFAPYDGKRLVKTFYIAKKTLDKYNDFYFEYKKNHKIFRSELYELCIYLYVINNFSEIEKQMVKFYDTNFGIHSLKY